MSGVIFYKQAYLQLVSQIDTLTTQIENGLHTDPAFIAGKLKHALMLAEARAISTKKDG